MAVFRLALGKAWVRLETQEKAAREGGKSGGAPIEEHVDHSRLHVMLQHLSEIVRSAPFILILTDAAGVIQYVNPRFTAAIGYEADEAIGSNIRDLAADSPTHADAWETLMGGNSWTGEVRLARKDGGDYWAQASVQPLRAATGEVQWFVGMHVEITDQKRVERELEESNAHWRALAESAPNFIAELNRDGMILSINRVSYGARQDEVEGQLIFHFVPEEYHAAWRDCLSTVFDQGKRCEIEYAAAAVRGDRTVWWHSALGPVSDGDKVKTAIVVSTDLSERRRMEESLTERDAYWRALMESAPAFIITVDRAGTIMTVNREIDGGKPDEAEGHSLFDFTEESVHDSQKDALRRVFELGETVELENRAALTTGEVRWWSYTIAPVIRDDEVVAGVIVSYDITKRKEAEERLRKSEAQWRALLENAPDFILIVDQEGTILRLNRAAGDATTEAAIGRKVLDYADEESHDEWRSALKRVFETGDRATVEGKSRRMGEPRWFSSSVGPVYDDARVTAAVVVARDVTARRLAEERLRAFATAVPDVIVVLDEDGTFVEVMRSPHDGLAAPLGPPEELRGSKISEFLTEEETHRVCEFIQGTIQSGQPQEANDTFMLPTGQAWVSVRAAPMTLTDGRRAVVMHATDVTKRKVLEAELEALREEVEAQAEQRHADAAEFGLTFRELTVLGFIARGSSDKEIAALLGVSPFTVNKQSASAMRKLQARSRSEAVARAVRAGII